MAFETLERMAQPNEAKGPSGVVLECRACCQPTDRCDRYHREHGEDENLCFGALARETMATIFATYHKKEACPCRKKHQPMKFPEQKPSPPGAGKAMARLREGLAELEDAADDESRYRAERKIARAETELSSLAGPLRVQAEEYQEQLRSYRTDLCANCGASLMCPNLSLGCPRCV